LVTFFYKNQTEQKMITPNCGCFLKCVILENISK
jgi:hypothetical protein